MKVILKFKIVAYLSFFLMLPISISQAIMWDFNNKAHEKDWKVISGTCEIDKDGTYKVSNPSGEALAIVGDVNWTDYTISCKARLTEPAAFNNIAIAFRVSEDGSNEYILMFEGGRKQAEWWKKVAGAYTEIKVMQLDIDLKKWFDIKVIAKDDKFEGFYNDEAIVSIKDSDLKKGKVGVRVYGCTSHIDNFEVNGPGIPPTAVTKLGKFTTTWGGLKEFY